MESRLTFPLAGGSAHKDSCAVIGGLVPLVVVTPTVATIQTKDGLGFPPLDSGHRDETQIQCLHGLSPRCLRCLVVGLTFSGTPRMPPFLFVSSTILVQVLAGKVDDSQGVQAGKELAQHVHLKTILLRD